MKQICIGLVFTLLYQIGDVDTRCPDDQYWSNYNQKCVNCYHNCYSRGNDSTCFWCPSGCPCENNYTNNCYRNNCQTCPDGYYKSDKSCRRCYYYGCVCSSRSNCPRCLTGRYGQYCEETCPAGCKDRMCDKSTGGCTNGCTSGYFLDVVNQCTRCPLRCSSCDSAERCHTCVDQYNWGPGCQYNCTGCSEGCDKASGCLQSCIGGYFKQYSNSKAGHVCELCPNSCVQCSSIDSCSACVSGYWGYKCQHSCSGCVSTACDKDRGCTSGCSNGYYLETNAAETICHTCPSSCDGKCNKLTGYCIRCNSNQYFDMSSYYCRNCSNRCNSCTSNYQCTSCESGWWGSTCNIQCNSNCLEKCLQSNGRCLDGCKPGYHGIFCNENCLTECETCSERLSCDTCKQGFFDSDRSSRCLCDTNKCNVSDNNVCTQCNLSTWYPFGGGCCPCTNPFCAQGICNSDGTCTECKGGRTGVHCNHECISFDNSCNRCKGDTRNTFECLSCKSGHYPVDGHCINCIALHCKQGFAPICDPTTGECNYGCDEQWYGRKCNNKCSKNCKFNTCDSADGYCNDGCIDGLTGATCDTNCHVSCLSCNQSFADICNKCSLNFYGDNCKLNCSVNCFVNTVERVCDTHNGSCLHGCKKGFWGAECVLPCSDGCIQDVCDQSSGQCTNGCKTEFYGSLCYQTCNEHCSLAPKGNDLNRTCNEMNGTCLFGCIPGSYGGFCDKPCSQNCNGSTCERKSGSCLYGCVSGYEGETCTEALLSDESDISAVVIAGGTGGGVAALIILSIVIVVVIVRRRRNSSKLDTHDTVGTHTPQKIASTDIGPVYSNINDSGIQNADGGPNAVTNQLYTNTVIRMSDISGNEQVGNATLARPGSENYLTEEEMVDGERIDVEQSVTSGVPDNTYYNLGGKRVQVEKLADYVKHTCTKDIIQEFHEIPKGLLKGYKEAKKSKNAAKNKYKLIYPYDETRVILCDGDNDYMNASYIDGHTRQKEYIASSGPFKKSYDTTNDFWRMILQEKCETLVMLTNPTENKEVKCEKYWPDVGQSCNFGNIHVTCVTEDIYADFTIRTLAATKKEEKFNVCHLHFTAWPDKGVPHDVTSMIEFRQKVRSLHKDKTCPIIVHCSAGIGRTGTFIALDLMTNEGEDRGSVDIFGSVFNLRYQRCNMVQTPDQYVYLHHALLHSLTFDCHSIPGDTFLQNYNKLLEKNGGQRIIDNQYQQLQSVAEELTDDDRTEIDRNKALVKKNRSGADVPVDENRVKLKENRKPEDSGYINAVYINSFRKHQKFIVAQTPLPSTVVDFLTLIYQEKCSCVVSMEEANMKDKTVKVYWPADNQIVKHGVFQVSCKESKTEKNYMIKKLSLTYHGPKVMETHDVNLFIFTNWREGAPVPSSSDSLLDLVKTVDVMNYKTETNSPILIHCRTGAERSCLYCAVSVLIEKMEIEHEVSVVNTLRQIKARRMSAISSIDQYKFCHQAVITYLQSFDTYSNFR